MLDRLTDYARTLTALGADVRHARFNSALARRFLDQVFAPGKSYVVPFGPLRHHRLYYDRSVNYHVILGLWEVETYRFLSAVLPELLPRRERLVFADVGANLGYFSLWARRAFGPSAAIFAFEPAPSVREKLCRNLELNAADSVVVVPQACSDHVGDVDFFESDKHHVSSVIETWAARRGKAQTQKLTVQSTTLDAFFEERGELPDFVKVDIEGGGVYALKGVDACVRRARPLMWIESHLPDEDRAISDLLLRHDYRAYRLHDHCLVADRSKIHPDPHGVWGTVFAYPPELAERTEHLLSSLGWLRAKVS